MRQEAGGRRPGGREAKRGRVGAGRLESVSVVKGQSRGREVDSTRATSSRGEPRRAAKRGEGGEEGEWRQVERIQVESKRGGGGGRGVASGGLSR
jgi:hypothetical protein